MLVFGGFSGGKATNDMYQYFFKENIWQRVIYGKVTKAPPPRAGHSAVSVANEDKDEDIYIFGGKDS
jgi:N-acetylneuraminic acid mutarotase